MTPIQIISQDVFDKIRSRFSNLEMGDETGVVTIDPKEARFFDFDFVREGVDLGRVSISLNDLGSLKLYYSQGITENHNSAAKKLWFNFLKEMRFFAKRRLLRFDTRDIAKTHLDKNDFQHLAKTQSPKDADMTMNESKKKQNIKESVMDDKALWGQYGQYTVQDLMSAPELLRGGIDRKEAQTIVNFSEYGWSGVPDKQKYRDEVVKRIKAILGKSTSKRPEGRANDTNDPDYALAKEYTELFPRFGGYSEQILRSMAEKIKINAEYKNSILNDINRKKDQLANLKESRWNGRSSRKTSRATSGATEVIVRHHSPVEETYPGARSQRKNIKAIFIQNREGERFKYPFIHSAGAFAMAQHVDHGGIPHDPAGKAIIRMSEEIAQLQEFQKHIQHQTLHDDATGITERTLAKLNELKSKVSSLGKRHHYESWLAEFNEQEFDDENLTELDAVTMEDYKSKFTQTSFQEDLMKYFPLIHKIMQEENKVDLEEYVEEAGIPSYPFPFTNEQGEIIGGIAGGPVGAELGKGAAGITRAVQPNKKFEDWANSVESGKITPDQVENLINAITDLKSSGQELELGVDGETAWEFFSNEDFGLIDTGEDNDFSKAVNNLKQDFQGAANSPTTTDAFAVFKNWLENTGSELFDEADLQKLYQTLGSDEQGEQPAGEQPAGEQPAGEQPAAENDDMISPNTIESESSSISIESLAKKGIAPFDNIDNSEVAPFRAEENIATGLKKDCEEKYGEEIAEKVRLKSLELMQLKNEEWRQLHGKSKDFTNDDPLTRMKELVGTIKKNIETISDDPIDSDTLTTYDQSSEMIPEISRIQKLAGMN